MSFFEIFAQCFSLFWHFDVFDIYYFIWISMLLASTTSKFCILILLRVWKAAGLCTHILEGHGGAVSSISFLKSDGMSLC